MNRLESFLGFEGEAQVRFLDGEFQVVSPGEFVRCALTGTHIPLGELKYWSVELQEAYLSADVSWQRYCELRESGDLE